MGKSNIKLGKYVDIRTDFGFKFYFGREEYKSILIDFLNGLFQGEKVIQDLTYRSTERNGEVDSERRAIFDLYCTGEDGEHFIIEMQQVSQEFFRDRVLFYTTRLISQLGKKGSGGDSYELPEVYFIGVLEFELEQGPSDKYFYDVALLEKDTKEIFYDKLGFKFLVLPNFKKEEAAIQSDMDQWIYVLKNLSRLERLPDFLDKRVFGLIFDIGAVANLKKEEMISYEASLKRKRDEVNIRASLENKGFKRGVEEGLELGKRAIALKMKKNGIATGSISEMTGLSIEEIEKLK